MNWTHRVGLLQVFREGFIGLALAPQELILGFSIVISGRSSLYLFLVES